ncbi:hypothetical protein [Oceanicoccus sagamiensis]|uniref:Uncharacterized protein n=1 Tax=Oceanicoccus sagamiensis TaxID=716816 RepID=A0A1X9NFI8_9GAMM|nr:hypothetical protein [Oceanicoccus sagamiensis]ARN75192.1 hypothetical protein BST96_14350 [Oceanicoccus sagamiensis]
MMKIKLPLFLVLVFLNLSYGLSVSHAERKYQIKFGYASTNDGKIFSYLKEARLIPLIPKSQGIYYGLEIIPRDKTPYKILIKYSKPGKRGLELGSYNGQGEMTIPMGFDNGDKPGIYKLDVYIDDKKEESITFEAKVFNPS